MGSRGKGGGGGSGGNQATYQGQQMGADQAQAKYQQDLANWRAPTTMGASPVGMAPVSSTNFNTIPGVNDAGPPLPAFGIPPAPPVSRNNIAQAITPQASFYPGGGTSHSSSVGLGNSFGGRR